MADMLITIPDYVLDKIRNTSIRTESVSVAIENAVQKGMVLPEGVMPQIISAIRKYETISNLASVTGTSFEKAASELERLERDITNSCLEDLKDSVIKENKR